MARIKFSEDETRTFKNLFDKYCDREIQAGRCDGLHCGNCTIWNAKEKIFFCDLYRAGDEEGEREKNND